MAITKLEKDTIRAFVLRNKDESKHYVSTADKSSIMINKEANAFLSYVTLMYNREHGGTKLGKGAVLNVLLQDFANEQIATFKFQEIDLKAYQSSTLNAIQQAKKIFHNLCSDDISQASDVVYAICLYHILHHWEVASGIRVTDFRDDQYESEHEPKMEPLDGVEDYSKLGKKELKKLASLSTPIVQPINPPPFIVQPVVKPAVEPPQPVPQPLPEQSQIKISEPITDPLPPVPDEPKPEPLDTTRYDEPYYFLFPITKSKSAPVEPDHTIDDLFEDDDVDSEDDQPPEEEQIKPAPVKEESSPMSRFAIMQKIRERQRGER